MKHLYPLVLAFLFIASPNASAGYACPAAGDTSGGWVPQECAQKQEFISQYACPSAGDTRGGWLPPACSSKKVACPDCGVVEKISMTDESATGLGAAAGAIAGGLIGNKVSDKNKKLSTAIGAVAGGGHYAEKKLLKRKRWDVIILMTMAPIARSSSMQSPNSSRATRSRSRATA
jgi:hypothetical protein